MDGTVNDFFNEIDQIVPPKEPKDESAWQECYDSSTGYSYYWNVKTDEVTWEMPEEYKLWKQRNAPHKSSGNLYVPPKSTPLFPSATISNTKIYKIQDDSQNISVDDCGLGKSHKRVVSIEAPKQANVKKCRVGPNGTEERIVLISSYGDGDSESDTETEKRTVEIVKNDSAVDVPGPPSDIPDAQSNSNSRSNDSDNEEEEDIDLLTQIQNRAKVLRELGGELPPDVEKLVEKTDADAATKETPLPPKHTKKEKKDVTGFSLLAGYGDSNDEEEEEEEKPEEAKVEVSACIKESTTSHSTLFPIAKPIDIKQFTQVEPKTPEEEVERLESRNVFDSRAFHRKRRIGINLAPINRKTKEETDGLKADRLGLGFKAETETDTPGIDDTKADYHGFKSGGLMFVKSHVLCPSGDSNNTEQVINDDSGEAKIETMSKIEDIRKTLNEKLLFLNVGRDSASPVQIMIIQLETLYEAAKEGSLTTSYLHRWLKETCSELVKLEKDAAPSGWLLQWDRINKRYYYRNQQTGDSQWEYPQPDIVGGDEAMDICTTPPPTIENDVVLPPEPTGPPLQPPPPPRIKSPTPPPPPTISKHVKQKKRGSAAGKTHRQPPLPPEIVLPPLPVSEKLSTGEPLPPGVDVAEVGNYESSLAPPPEATDKAPPASNTNDVLGTALNSFYSDLAALETEAATPAPTTSVVVVPQYKENIVARDNVIQEVPSKKRKKTKVKVVQGLAMKKKGVSKLVERWKNVQKDY